MDTLFTDGLRALLDGICGPEVVRDLEARQDAAQLWKQIEESGFADVLVSEDKGGAGLSLAQAYPLFEMCGAMAVPVPLAETMLARGQLSQAGMATGHGSITFASGRRQADGSIVCDQVSHGQLADQVLVSVQGECRLLNAADARKSPLPFPLDAVLSWHGDTWRQALLVPGLGDIRVLHACVAAALIAGALDTVFRRTLQYANDRQQFGRPIGKFQAIQHQIGVMSEASFAAGMAARNGCEGAGIMPDPLRVAVAKARTSEAAVEVAGLSHSIHGAIGFTAEFDLQLYTRRLHLWRQAAGSESWWHDVLGAELVDRRQGMALDLLRDLSEIA